jgi:TPP-dependent indolepyruvate ferredoxin oxidoreductase alpha subunit
VSTLPVQVEHYESCDRDVYGRAVVWYMQGDPDLITAENIRAFVKGYRESGEPCTCLGMRINAAVDLHRRLKLMFEAQLSEANAAAVVAAKAELARLRGMA